MRFTVQDHFLVPDSSFSKDSDSRPITYIDHFPQPPLNPDFPFNGELQNLLAGKQLLLSDLPFSIDLIQAHYENGYLQYRKSIAIENHQPICIRCGNQEPHLFATFQCVSCQEECMYCRNCIMMGKTSTCTPLMGWTGPIPVTDINKAHLEWTGTLSDGQSIASKKMVEAVANSDSLLVWAVCGAGKTEVLFEGIHGALQQGKRVCLATPRTDVVLELSPRLKKVFPHLVVATLYGGSEDRHVSAPLTIATTHQLLRFYRAFDLIILDEVDAFPYSVDASLQYAVEQARKPTSSIIYLTATPDEQWQKECRKGKRNVVTIPARFHRYSLPIPQFRWCGNWRKRLKKGSLPPNVLEWVTQRINAEKQALLFFPRIQLMEGLLPILQKIHPKIEAVYSEDPLRKEKVQHMREKKIPLLLTTTILERGVTFPNLDVAVFGAEDRIFTESALVQIAGRVGRSSDYPSGDITFFHYGKTNAMVKARKQIIKMNQEAREKGLVDD